MPELPEVQTIVSQLHAQVSGLTIARADLRHSDFWRNAQRGAGFPKSLVGRRIDAVRREAKRIWVDLDDGSRMLIHLGMTGRVLVQAPTEKLEPHTHLRLRFKDQDCEMRCRDPRRFGGVWWFAAGTDTTAMLSAVGPDALTVKTKDFLKLCERARPIKALLLDQTRIAGLGNIYADEALFDARVHPLTHAVDIPVDRQKLLAKGVRKVLRHAINFGGSTLRDFVNADGRMGEFQNIHRVYGREGEPCVRCKTPILRIQAAGRSSHVCPACQPEV